MKHLTSPTGKPLALPPIHANQGITVAYQKRLKKLVEEMHRSLIYHLAAEYKRREAEIVQDDSPPMALQYVVQTLAKRWIKIFQEQAKGISERFSSGALRYADGALKSHLKANGMTVNFQMTRNMHNTLQSVIGEQVGLIKSIPEQYFSQVEGAVMRSVSAGRDLKTLSDELQKRYDLTRKRAVLIATDQTNKAHAMLERTRQLDLGITTAIWMHSGGGRHPRPHHVAFSGKEFSLKDGALIDGKIVWPGTEINCRCVSRPVIR